jgi:hypothetical protein
MMIFIVYFFPLFSDRKSLKIRMSQNRNRSHEREVSRSQSKSKSRSRSRSLSSTSSYSIHFFPLFHFEIDFIYSIVVVQQKLENGMVIQVIVSMFHHLILVHLDVILKIFFRNMEQSMKYVINLPEILNVFFPCW